MRLDTTINWLKTDFHEALIALGVAALLVLLMVAIRGWVGDRRKGSGTWLATAFDIVGKTKLWFIVTLSARLAVQFIEVPSGVESTVEFLFVITATLQAAIWARVRWMLAADWAT